MTETLPELGTFEELGSKPKSLIDIYRIVAITRVDALTDSP